MGGVKRNFAMLLQVLPPVFDAIAQRFKASEKCIKPLNVIWAKRPANALYRPELMLMVKRQEVDQNCRRQL
jgi:hypothetical protein